ncbi:MAG TPA: DUF1778 domain-containing protein [Terriglobia bacterium]|nr:DUF1778 domain-containing protein [Terriglobia bacterium]
MQVYVNGLEWLARKLKQNGIRYTKYERTPPQPSVRNRAAYSNYFQLDEKAFKKFSAALDKPPVENRRLRKLLLSKAPWTK